MTPEQAEIEFNRESTARMLDEKYQNKAYGLENAPKDISILDRGYFEKLKEIYADYKNAKISIEKAKIVKIKLQDEYFEIFEKILTGAVVYMQYQSKIKASDELRSKLALCNDKDDALNIALEIVGVLTEKATVKTVKDKFNL